MSRSFYLAGVAFLSVALLLGLLVSLSLPTLPALDFVRITVPDAPKGNLFLSELRLGIWAPCAYDGNGVRTCQFSGHGYSQALFSADYAQHAVLTSSWTRGLAIHPVATFFTAIALGCAVMPWEHGTLAATFAAFIAAFLGFIAFIVDIALFAHTKSLVDTFTRPPHTSTAPAFWLAFIALILTLLSGCTVCFGRRRDSGSSYPTFSGASGGGGILARFRKN
ncbi:hypothetical protein GGX14DRAFT_606504 [Mycena pura]|uniref:Pali-domain-containing protein n=1 Tax=Mycena pura TaxID=153505 RepID=A0AAD6ULH1_9AGAR|nr:hypothetical protein GGX14DRAFT_606504 [Mycena pura]